MNFPAEGFGTMVFLFYEHWPVNSLVIGANDVQFGGRYLCIWLEVICDMQQLDRIEEESMEKF
jgi:hypothetical protein